MEFRAESTPMEMTENSQQTAMDVVYSPQVTTQTTDGNGVPSPANSQDDGGSPPPIDDQSLHDSLEKNREKLKVKLLTRRPMHQLVQQGIIPPMKASPHFLEQKQRLERAKMGDFLKNKMQHRPDRDTLIRAHILEDTPPKLDPSLQEKQQKLKRARLKDDLNDRLAHRPGPLELIRGNILQADEQFAQAIKAGTIPFKRTCEGDPVPDETELISESSDDSHQGNETVEAAVVAPKARIAVESQPQSQPLPQIIKQKFEATAIPKNVIIPTIPKTVQVPQTTLVLRAADTHPMILCTSDGSNSVAKTSIPTPPPLPATPVYFTVSSQPTLKTTRPLQNAQIVTKKKFIPNPKQASYAQQQIQLPSVAPPQSNTVKNRIIKFHEYKGPPSAASKEKEIDDLEHETPYELLLQQQKVFLQWQAENGQVTGPKQKIILPAPSNPQQLSAAINSDSYKLKCSKLEDMKVSDLKVELKKRNLPVSGSKPQLIERLKPYTDEIASGKTENGSLETQQSNGVSSDQTTEDDPESVMAQMDILRRELLNKQRLQTLLSQQQAQQTNVITITDGNFQCADPGTIQVNRVLCQPNVQIIHAKPQLVALQMSKVDPSNVVSVAGLTPQNIAILSQLPAPGTVESHRQKFQQQLVNMQPNAQIISHVQPLRITTNNNTIQFQKSTQDNAASVIHKPYMQQQLQQKLFLQKDLPKELHSRICVPGTSTSSSLSPASSSPSSPTAKAVTDSRKNSLDISQNQEPLKNTSSTQSLPSEMEKFLRQPPGYNEATKNLRNESELNLNDIFEIISKQDQQARFEVIKNPETGVVTLKEVTADTPQNCQIVTTDLKTPIVVENPTTPPPPLVQTHFVKKRIELFEQKAMDLDSKTAPTFKAGACPSAVRHGLPCAQSMAAGSTVQMVRNQFLAAVEAQQNGFHQQTNEGRTDCHMPSEPLQHPMDEHHAQHLQASQQSQPHLQQDQSQHHVQPAHHYPMHHDLAVPHDHHQMSHGPEAQHQSLQDKQQEDKSLDFNVDLDNLESMDLGFDIMQPHQNQHNNIQKQYNKSTNSVDEQMSTDFSDLDWWSNDLFQTKFDHNQPTQPTDGGLQTPDILPSLDPMLSFTNPNLRDHKASHNRPPSISLYSDMQGLMCDDVIMSDWSNPVHNMDIQMQM